MFFGGLFLVSRLFGQVLSKHERVAIGIVEGCGADHAFDGLRRSVEFDTGLFQRTAGTCDIGHAEDGNRVSGRGFGLFFDTRTQWDRKLGT